MAKKLSEVLPKHIPAERLLLELLDYSDTHCDPLLAAVNDPSTYATMGDVGLRTSSDIYAYNQSCRLYPSVCNGLDTDRDICYTMRLRSEEGSPVVGLISLNQRGEKVVPDMGWIVVPKYSGKGYAPEAAKVLLNFVTKDLGIEKIMATPGEKNQASIRVAEKIGLVRGPNILDKQGGLHMAYMLPGMEIDSGMVVNFRGERSEMEAKGD